MADEASKTSYISNYMGWIVRCIEEGWFSTPVVDASSQRGSQVVEVIEAYEKADKEALAKKMWDRIRKKDDFAAFVSVMEESGIALERYEAVYTYDELTQAYTDWKAGKPIVL